ncbi:MULTISPECIES: hypothetical protein [Pseudomonas]|uniref:hypothetical protein n=1 Tax=Pseudomonas TaxID=286 RepID=UPI000F7905A9|nr:MULTISPECIES: hypothetical protein [Pseudomonas]CAH0649109.1 hypothetical protein PSNVIR_03379 [Pseudomonas sp. Nvir]
MVITEPQDEERQIPGCENDHQPFLAAVGLPVNFGTESVKQAGLVERRLQRIERILGLEPISQEA